MTRLSKHLASGSAALLALSLTGIALATAHNAAPSDEPINCEIRSTENRGMITLQSLIHSESAISGQYRFKVQSAGGSGSSNISQGSNFTARAGEPVEIGRMMLSAGSVYDASLEVTVSGVTFTCAERIGGAT